MGATACDTATLVTPGSTVTRWLGRSTSSTRRSRVSAISTPSSTGSAPPDSPEPEPRATHGTLGLVAGGHDRAHLARPFPGSTTACGSAAYWVRPSDS